MRNLVGRLVAVLMIIATLLVSQSMTAQAAAGGVVQEQETEAQEYVVYYGVNDAEELRAICEVECQGLTDPNQIAAVMWTVLNRVDSPAFPNTNTVHDVIYAPNQFAVRYIGHVPYREDMLAIANDVLARWNAEKNGLLEPSLASSGRVIPPDSVFFWGDGRRNHFNNGVIEYALDTENSPYNN